MADLTPAKRAAELYPDDFAPHRFISAKAREAERGAYIRGDAEGYARAIEACAQYAERCWHKDLANALRALGFTEHKP